MDWLGAVVWFVVQHCPALVGLIVPGSALGSGRSLAAIDGGHGWWWSVFGRNISPYGEDSWLGVCSYLGCAVFRAKMSVSSVRYLATFALGYDMLVPRTGTTSQSVVLLVRALRIS